MPTFTYDVVARVPLDNGTDLPVYSVALAVNGEAVRLLGLAQANPSIPEKWLAVATLDPASPPTVDPERGLAGMRPARGGFGSKREAAVWLLGMSDALTLTWRGTPPEGN